MSITDEIYKRLNFLKGNSSFLKVIRSMLDQENSKQKILNLFDSNLGFDENSLKELKKGWSRWREFSDKINLLLMKEIC